MPHAVAPRHHISVPVRFRVLRNARSRWRLICPLASGSIVLEALIAQKASCRVTLVKREEEL